MWNTINDDDIKTHFHCWSFQWQCFFQLQDTLCITQWSRSRASLQAVTIYFIISASAGVNEATPHWDLCLHFKSCRNITLLLLRHFTWASCQSNLSIPWVNHVSRCVQKAVRMKEQKWSFSSHVSIRTRALKTRLF